MDDNTELKPGRITSIRSQSKSPDRVSIFIDGRFAFGMHRDLLLEFDLARGKRIEVEQQAAILRRDMFFKARTVAFRYLSYRDRSAFEIRRRLQRGEYSEDVIEDVVQHLENAGWIDDRRFAVAFAEGRFRSRGYGPVRVLADLRKKGIHSAVAEQAIADVFAERDELLERARIMGRKRWQQLRSEEDERKRKKKVYDYLARRGYRFEVVRRIVEELEDA